MKGYLAATIMCMVTVRGKIEVIRQQRVLLPCKYQYYSRNPEHYENSFLLGIVTRVQVVVSCVDLVYPREDDI